MAAGKLRLAAAAFVGMCRSLRETAAVTIVVVYDRVVFRSSVLFPDGFRV